MADIDYRRKKVGFVELSVGTTPIEISLSSGGKKEILFINDDTTNYLIVNFDGDVPVDISGSDGASTADSVIFTSSGSTFLSGGVQPGDLLYISSGSDIGVYEIKSVDSETQLRLCTPLANAATSLNFSVMGWRIKAGESRPLHANGKTLSVKASADTVSTRISIQYHIE